MSKFISLTLLMLVTLLFYCTNEPDYIEPLVSISQKPGCGGFSLNKSSIDTCFNYKFGKELEINFCVVGNCCPDSNRFKFSHRIYADTINISLADTAQNLCRCICNYLIESKIQSLPLNKYIVKVEQNFESEKKLLYTKIVYRNK